VVEVPVFIPPPGRYVIDPARSRIRFTAKHQFGLGTVRGGFAVRSGEMTVTDPLADSTLRAVADAASFESGNKAREKKVLSETFLDVERHPDIEFVSTAVTENGAGTWTLRGEITARGGRAPAEFTITQATENGDGFAVVASGRVDRYVHGITAMKGMAGRYLDLTAEIQARPAAAPDLSDNRSTAHNTARHPTPGTFERNLMSDLKIAIILGSTRPGRNGKAVADWVLEKSASRTAAKYELVDLADYPLPHMDEPLPPTMGQYAGAHTKAWAAKIAEFDGFIFVTPEYNHSTTGVLKNALDYLFAEWTNKAAGFVSYGSLGGARAIEHLRAICSELQMAHVRQQLSFSLFTDFENFSTFKPAEMYNATSGVLFDQLESWAGALKPLREA
jgi:NAD(P)H-dependent FMN reductase/polyisoprenoid-binding protein YceI